MSKHLKPMKYSLFAIVFAFSINASTGQRLVESVNKVYHSDTNIIRYSYSNFPEKLFIDLNESDTISPGTDASKGIVMTALIGKDTLRIFGDNYPFERHTFVTVEYPGGMKVIQFRFNASPAYFSQDYIRAHQRRISFETPEVYELANIIWTLSPSGRKASDLQKNTTYFRKVEKYFRPYLNHPVFAKLITNDSNYFQSYYEFRENSFMYEFSGDKIVKGDNYNLVYGDDWLNFNNLFTELLPLVQDFSDQSNFRRFYQKNKSFYASDCQELQALLPVQDMWQWLEKEFPIHVDAYKIVFSPLILGSHSTQKYIGLFVTGDTSYSLYTETIMFICDAQHLNGSKKITELEKQGLMSGIVFTEIDHNYVNPVSANYWHDIEAIFDADVWVDSNKNILYESPFSVFNEYMTHAVFCLWVSEKYEVATADYVIAKRIELNAKYRGFRKFEAFNAELFRLRKTHPGKTVAELYPLMLEWSKTQL